VVRRRISWFVYVVRLAPHFSQMQRDWILKEMNNRGIGCGRYFAPIHLQPAYRDVVAPRDGLKVTEFVAARCLALPFFNRLEEAQIKEVCGNLGELVEMAERLAPAGKAASGA
jgi:perosamine synthetase